jgi:hypothetical protein
MVLNELLGEIHIGDALGGNENLSKLDVSRKRSGATKK